MADTLAADLLGQAISVPVVPPVEQLEVRPPAMVEPPIPNVPPPPVSEANVMRHRTALENAVTRYTGAGADTQTDRRAVDVGSLPRWMLRERFGTRQAQDMVQQNLAGQAEYERLQGTPRTLNEAAGDAAIDVPRGLVSGLGGVAALGAGLVSPRAGAFIADAVNQGSEWAGGFQSDATQNRGRIGEIRSRLNEEDNDAQRERDIEEGVSPLRAGLRSIGRGILNGVADTVSDNTRLSSGIAQGVGSLFAGGVVGRGIRAAGAVLPGAAGRAIAGAATPVGIGIQEGGGAYQQVNSEVMGMSFDDLTRTSPAYRELIERGETPEDARLALANRAGQFAAAIVAPIAGGTGAALQGIAGRIVGRPLAYLEEAPLRVPTTRAGIAQIANEFLEEGYQGGVSGLAGNLAIQQTADENRALASNVGAQIGEGAVVGLGTAGAVQGPGVAGRAAQSLARATGNAVAGAAEQAAERREERRDAASPQSTARIAELTQRLTAPTPEAASELQTAIESQPAETREIVRDYVTRMDQALRFDPGSVPATVNPVIREALQVVNTRSGVISELGKIILNNKDPDTVLDAVGLLQRNLMAFNALKDSNPEAIEALADDNPIVQRMNDFADLGDMITANPRVAKAFAARESILAQRAAVPPVTPTSTPAEVQRSVEEVNLALTVDPTKITQDKLKGIAYHIENNGLVLTPDQQRAYDQATALVSSIDKAVKANQGFGHTDAMRSINQEVLNAEESGNLGVHAKSVRKHWTDVVGAFNAGRTSEATERLRDFGFFVLHQNNKVKALNESVQTGKRTLYRAIDKRNRWYDSDVPMIVHPNAGSIKFAQQVQLEAQRAAEIYNLLVSTMPDVGAKALSVIPLAPELNAKVDQAVENVKALREQQLAVDPEAEADAKRYEVIAEEAEAEAKAQPKAEPKTEPKTEAAPKTGMQNLFPNLKEAVTEGVKNFIHQHFKIPDQQNSRVVGHSSPLEFVQDELKQGVNIPSTADRQTNGMPVKEAYKKLLAMVPGLKNQLHKQLNAYLTKPNYSDGSSILDRLEDENATTTNPLLYSTGRMLHLIDNDTARYNDNLIEGAILGGLQWLINGEQMRQRHDVESLAKMLNISPEDVSDDMLDIFNENMLTNEVIGSITNNIKNYWGLQTSNDAPVGYTQGLLQAAAAEVVRGFLNQNLMTMIEKVPVMDKTGTYKTYNLFKPNLNEDLLDGLRIIPQWLDKAILVKPEQTMFVGETNQPTEADVPKYQLNSPVVENTPQDKKAIAHANKTAFRANMQMASFYKLLGKEGFKSLFGPKTKAVNVKHAIRNNGILTMLDGAYDHVAATIQALQNADPENPGDVPVFYTHNVTGVGRLQMLGAYNPQSNKLVREVLLPTWASIDMTNPDQEFLFHIGVAQALGFSVHKKSNAEVTAYFHAAIEKLDEVIQMLQTMEQADGLPDTAPEFIRDAFESPKGPSTTLSPLAIHALVEYARLQQTPDRSAFRTSLYVEADGVTNGIANAMMLLGTGDFETAELENLARVGFSLDPNIQSLDQRYSLGGEDAQDMYQMATNATNKAFQKLLNDTKDLKAKQRIRDVAKLMSLLKSSTIDVKVGDNGNLEIGRNTLKNPMTITLYGSGKEGIAGNLVQALTDEIYEKLSLRAQGKTQFENELVRLVERLTSDAVLRKGKNGLFVTSSYAEGADLQKANSKTFEFSKKQIENMVQNMLVAFVDPMQEGIAATVGEQTLENARLVQRAIQIQSLILEDQYNKMLKEAFEEAKNKDNRTLDAYLSPKEMNEVLRKLADFAPIINVNGQRFYVAGSTQQVRAGKDNRVVYFSRSLNDRLEMPGTTFGPSDAGVAGMPFLNIGMGDGKMIQLLTTMPDAPKDAVYIFDGVNFSLAQLQPDSVKANKAAWGAWQGNTMLAVWQSYAPFLEAFSKAYPTMDNALANKIAEALRVDAKDSPDLITAIIKEEAPALLAGAKEVEARHRTLRQVDSFTDQMASARSPYAHKGKQTLPSDRNAQATILQNILNAERQRIAGENWSYTAEPKTPATPAPEAPAPKASADSVVVREALTIDGLKAMRRKLKLTPEQKQIYDDVLPALDKQNYKVFVGSPEEIRLYQEAHGLPQVAMTLRGKTIHGATDTGSKMIYLVSASPETLVHEMVHAATLETLIGYYGGDLTNEGLKTTIESLEESLAWFQSEENQQDMLSENAETQAAYRNALSQIRAAGDNKALAMNEFMAWNLANQQLAERAKSFTIQNFVKKAIDAIRRLVFGTARQGPRFKNQTWFEALRFSNAVLMAQNPSIVSEVNGNVAYMATSATADPRLTALSEGFKVLFNRFLDAAPSDVMRSKREQQATLEISRIADGVANAGAVFNLNAEQAHLMGQLSAAMAMDMFHDSSTFTEMNRLYRHVMANLTTASFRQDPSDTTGIDQARAQEMFDFVSGASFLIYDKTDANKRSSLLPVFMGLGMVSDQFRDVLSKIPPMKSEQDEGKTLDTLIENQATKMMDQLAGYYAGSNNPSVLAGFDSLMNSLRKQAISQTLLIEQALEPLGDSIKRGNEIFTRLGDALHEKVVTLPANNKITKKARSIASSVTGLLSEKYHEDTAEAWLSILNRTELNPLRELVSSLVGRTKANGEVYDLIKMTKTVTQQTRQEFREDLPGNLARKFKVRPTNEQWSSMFHALAKTDVLAITRGGKDWDKLINMLSHNSRVNARITALENRLENEYGTSWNRLQEKADQLAGYMMTGLTGGRNLLRNAEAVASLLNERGAVAPASLNQDMINDVDELISLYAWKRTHPDDQTAIRSLLKSEPDGMKGIIGYLNSMRIIEKHNAQHNARYNSLKGYVPSESTGGVNLIVARDADASRLLDMSYIRLGPYPTSAAETNREPKSYYYVPVNGRAPYNQGIIQNVKASSGGVDQSSGVTTTGHHAGVINDPYEVARIKSRWANERGTTDNLIPIMDAGGEIFAFERPLDPLMMEKLQQDTNLARMLGVWAGRQAEEISGRIMNEQVAKRLAEMWKNQKGTKAQDDYINLWDSTDPVIRDGLKLITPEMRKMLNDEFGTDGFMVRKDMINDTLGYREASIGNVWNNESRWSPKTQKMIKDTLMLFGGDNAYKYFVNAEDIIQNAVTHVKLIIVVKSVVVPMANMASNIGSLLVRGVSPLTISRQMPRMLNELHSYNTTRMELQRLNIDLKMETDPAIQNRLKARMQGIEDGWRRLSIWPLLARGEFSQVSDVGATREELLLSRGKLDQFIQTQVDKLPPEVVKVGRQVMITKETALFQGLQKAVAYGDFLGKAVLYHDLVAKGMDRNEALAMISEEFVNYDRLPGRFRGYLEKSGLLWFWAYKIGATKVAMSMLRRNPLQTLFATLAPIPSFMGSVDTPLNSNLGYKMLNGGIGWSVGPGQGFSGFGLHPLAQIAN